MALKRRDSGSNVFTLQRLALLSPHGKQEFYALCKGHPRTSQTNHQVIVEAKLIKMAGMNVHSFGGK